jgi:hypothetical protein
VLPPPPPEVPFREFDSTEPWNIPEGCPPLILSRSHDGSAPRLATILHLFRDRERLYALFSGVDASIVATHRDRDAALWEEDVLELFIAPERITRYFEIEVSPIGTVCDAVIDSPDGGRETMRADFTWDADGAWTAIRRVRRGEEGLWRFETLVTLPFADLGIDPPAAGERWRANFYRIDRHASLGDEYSAWKPTGKNPPDFHVPASFGEIVFAAP